VIERPEVHADITNTVFYPNADAAARKFVRPEILNDPTVYPPEPVLKRCFCSSPCPRRSSVWKAACGRS
jgi:putrescine transport system substrate-binding protein